MKLYSAMAGLAGAATLGAGLTVLPSSLIEKSPSKAPTYAENIAPILNDHCVNCHRPGQVAPFSLIGYDNAKKWSGMVAQVTHSGQMPPWKAEAGYGEFQGENRLSPAELQLIKDWSASGAPRGDVKKEAKPPVFASSAEWSLGKPDLLLTPNKPFQLDSEGSDVYRNFVMKTNFDKPVWVRAMDVLPGNPKIVHHVIVFLDKTGQASKLEDRADDGQEGYTSQGGGVGFVPSGSLGGWAPGVQARPTAPGTAFKIEPGTSVILQVHYHKSGKNEQDQTRVGLYFAKEPIEKEVKLNWLFNFLINIPPNDSNYQAKKVYTWKQDSTIYGVMPHMHLIGQSMKSWLEFPDGRIQPLINVPKWDFNWQLNYVLRNPIHVPAGTKQFVEAVYDNSTANINNPNTPPKRVTFGESTTDEMFLMIVPYTTDAKP